MRKKGTITHWKTAKGYGFIAPEAGGDTIFAHISSFDDRAYKPTVGQLVSYEQSEDRRGRVCAINVAILRSESSVLSRFKSIPPIILLIGGFIALVVLGIAIRKFPLSGLAVYVGMSLVTYIVYAVDKSAAQRGRWRTPETTLHALALFGGWPGAILAQDRLRHKTRKQPFQSIFWFTVLVNIGAFFFYLTPVGKQSFQSIISNILSLF